MRVVDGFDARDKPARPKDRFRNYSLSLKRTASGTTWSHSDRSITLPQNAPRRYRLVPHSASRKTPARPSQPRGDQPQPKPTQTSPRKPKPSPRPSLWFVGGLVGWCLPCCMSALTSGHDVGPCRWPIPRPSLAFLPLPRPFSFSSLYLV